MSEKRKSMADGCSPESTAFISLSVALALNSGARKN